MKNVLFDSNFFRHVFNMKDKEEEHDIKPDEISGLAGVPDEFVEGANLTETTKKRK